MIDHSVLASISLSVLIISDSLISLAINLMMSAKLLRNMDKVEQDEPFQLNSCNTIFENSPKKKYPDTDDQLPLIDISSLTGVGSSTVLEKQRCKRQIVEASKQWGFFQVVNHGVSNELLKKMNDEQRKLFRQPCDESSSNNNRFLSNTYRSGTPTPTNHFSWSEAFHIPLADIRSGNSNNNTLRLTIEELAGRLSELALKIAQVLAENVDSDSKGYFVENCSEETCYLRLNKYPPCPVSSDQVFGLMPHTDSDFLTILYQDQVGGLQLVKDNKWVTVKPNPQYLIINIGDLFQENLFASDFWNRLLLLEKQKSEVRIAYVSKQAISALVLDSHLNFSEAWSNDLYKSVEHRVMTNNKFERFSSAYFLCPSHDTVIRSRGGPPLYKKFSFGEFREQVQEDVRKLGRKVGLPRFRI